MTGAEDNKPSPQEDLMALLSNPEAMRLLAFGARTMTRVVDTGRELGKVASVIAPGIPGIPGLLGAPPANQPAPAPAAAPAATAPTHPPAAEPAAPSQPAPTEPTVAAQPVAPQPAPAGSMLVPIEAWNRVLDQLGNIHEAGQALADARERAAKAEVIAEFQVERREIAETQVARLESELEAATAKAPEPDPSPATEPAPDEVQAGTLPAAQRRVSRTVRRWLRG